jgi:hypothetical protein
MSNLPDGSVLIVSASREQARTKEGASRLNLITEISVAGVDQEVRARRGLATDVRELI